MRVFDLKETISRAILRIRNIKYLSGRHHMAAVFLLIFVLLIISTYVFISQKRELARKENILKSFYEDNMEKTGPEDKTIYPEQEMGLIKVHICGRVNKPGVYEVAPGSRIEDLIRMAGGAGQDASIDSLNLAREVFDGQKVYVPSLEEAMAGDFGDPYGEAVPGTDGDSGYGMLVNINTATSGELQNLPGIGPVTAEKIIRHREEYGAFKNREELMDVNGIGPAKFEQLKDLIDV